MQVTRLYSSNRNRLLILVAACVFLFTQTIDLQHSHGGDLNLQSDCHVCLKLGSQHDLAVAKPADLQTAFVAVHFQSTVLTPVFRTVHSYSPRGPPRLSS